MAYPSPTNTTTLIGKVSRDPELRTVAGDKSVLTLGIAVRKPARPESDDAPTADFFNVTVWGVEEDGGLIGPPNELGGGMLAGLVVPSAQAT